MILEYKKLYSTVDDMLVAAEKSNASLVRELNEECRVLYNKIFDTATTTDIVDKSMELDNIRQTCLSIVGVITGSEFLDSEELLTDAIESFSQIEKP